MSPPKNNPPIFVVGLPRSGSTLLSRLLNETPDIVSINDLYYLQYVMGEKALDKILNRDESKRFVNAILEVVSTRSNKNDNFVGQFRLKKGEIESIRSDAINALRQEPGDWVHCLNIVMSLVSDSVGKKRWADKTPQNFMHISLLRRAFPGAKFLFLFRHPFQALASLKFASGPGHDFRRYHPIVYAIYWRTAVRKYLAIKNSADDVGMIRYEDLLARQSDIIKYLGQFLETKIPDVNIAILGDNSSFGRRKRKRLRLTEEWICQKLASIEMIALGYPLKEIRPKISDIPELIILTGRFLIFQGKRLFLSKDGRRRIMSVFREALTKRTNLMKLSKMLMILVYITK